MDGRGSAAIIVAAWQFGLWAGLGLGLSGGAALAQDGEAAAGPVVELAPLTLESARDAAVGAGAPDIVEREEIRRSSGRGASHLLEDVAGADVAQDPSNPGITVNIRGLQDKTRVTVMVDGARQNFMQSGHGTSALAYVDPGLLRAVEVEKSVSAAAGGAGALAGAVNFRTLEPDDLLSPGAEWGGEASAGTGTNAAWFGGMAALAARPMEGVSALLAVSRSRLGDYATGEAGEVHLSSTQVFGAGAPVSFSGSDTASALAKLVLDPTPDLRLTLSYLDYRADFATGAAGLRDAQETSSRTATARAEWSPAGSVHSVEALAWWSGVSNDQERQARTGYGAFSLDFGLDTFGGSATDEIALDTRAGALDLAFGVEGFADSTTTVSLPETASDDPDDVWFRGSNPQGERRVGGLFARASLAPADWLRLRAGLRADAYDLQGTASVYDSGPAAGGGRTAGYVDLPVDQSGAAVLPSFGVSVLPTPGLELFADYSEGWRPPTLSESVFGGSHIGFALYFAPNPDLRPEHSRTVELGAAFERSGLLLEDDRLRTRVSVYNRQVTDYITSETVFGSPGGGADVNSYIGYVNVDGDTNMQGVEISAQYGTGRWDLGLSLDVSDTDMEGRYDAYPYDPAQGGGAARRTVTSSLVSPPPVQLSFTAQARFMGDRLLVGGRVRHAGQAKDSLSNYALEAFTTFDLWASLQITDHLRVNASVENVTDLAYVDPLGSSAYPAPGRTFLISLDAAF